MELDLVFTTKQSRTAPFAAASGFAGFAEVPERFDRETEQGDIDG